jgi:hypothetical protein
LRRSSICFCEQRCGVTAGHGLLQHGDQDGVHDLLPLLCGRAGGRGFAVQGLDQRPEALVALLVLVLLEGGDAGSQAQAGFDAHAVVVIGALDELLGGLRVLGGLGNREVPGAGDAADASGTGDHGGGAHLARNR